MMGRDRDKGLSVFFDQHFPCTTDKQVVYVDWRLGLLRFVLSFVMPGFLIYSFFLVQSQKRYITTKTYFTVSGANGASHGRSLASNVAEYITEESDRVVFVPSLIKSSYQLYKVCSQDSLNPGIPCKSDEQCISYYEQKAASCNVTTETCNYSSHAAWCTVNSTTTDMFAFKEQLKLTTLARAVCGTYGFSNYPPPGEVDRLFYESKLLDLLHLASQGGSRLLEGLDISSSSATSSSSRNYSHLFSVGADIVLTYHWRCDLDRNPGRYGCLVQRSVEVLDIVTRQTIITPLLPSAKGYPARQFQEAVGFRVHMKGTGGCYRTSVTSVLALFSRGFALNSLSLLFMTAVLLIFHAWYRVEQAEKVYARTRNDRVELMTTLNFHSSSTEVVPDEILSDDDRADDRAMDASPEPCLDSTGQPYMDSKYSSSGRPISMGSQHQQHQELQQQGEGEVHSCGDDEGEADRPHEEEGGLQHPEDFLSPSPPPQLFLPLKGSPRRPPARLPPLDRPISPQNK